jgi:hypothetical protein
MENNIIDAATSIELRAYLIARQIRGQIEVLSQIDLLKQPFASLYDAEIAKLFRRPTWTPLSSST